MPPKRGKRQATAEGTDAPSKKRSKTEGTSASRAPTAKPPRPQRKEQTLRELTHSQDFFCRAIAEAKANATAIDIYDKHTNSSVRRLPQNEIAVMGLNELAAQNKRGFFYHLPSRQSWKTPEREPLLPRVRAAESPGAEYPSVVMMDFRWDDEAQQAFWGLSQRARYLMCSLLINPPTSATPLYAMQYVDWARAQMYVTSKRSLTIISSEHCFYLASTDQLVSTVGTWSASGKRKKPEGADPHMRLDTAPYLFGTPSAIASNEHRQKFEAIQQFKLSGLPQVYAACMARCKLYTGDISPSMTSADIPAVVPRGSSTGGGLPLGTPFTSQADRTAPEAARRRPRKKPKDKLSADDEMVDLDEDEDNDDELGDDEIDDMLSDEEDA